MCRPAGRQLDPQRHGTGPRPRTESAPWRRSRLRLSSCEENASIPLFGHAGGRLRLNHAGRGGRKRLGELKMETRDGSSSWTKTNLESNKSRKKIAPIKDRVFRKCAMRSSPTPTKKSGAAKASHPLPHHEVTLANMLRGILPPGKHYFFGQASKRTVDSHADLRWGPDKKGFRRIIHSNGVCLTGLWEITEKTAIFRLF